MQPLYNTEHHENNFKDTVSQLFEREWIYLINTFYEKYGENKSPNFFSSESNCRVVTKYDNLSANIEILKMKYR
jgi:hypothetical protein